MSAATSAMVNHSDMAQAAFNVEVNLMAAAAATTTGDESTRGPSDQDSASVARAVLAAATTTLSATGDVGLTEGSHGRMEQLEEDVDKLMQKMGIHGNNNNK